MCLRSAIFNLRVVLEKKKGECKKIKIKINWTCFKLSLLSLFSVPKEYRNLFFRKQNKKTHLYNNNTLFLKEIKRKVTKKKHMDKPSQTKLYAGLVIYRIQRNVEYLLLNDSFTNKKHWFCPKGQIIGNEEEIKYVLFSLSLFLYISVNLFFLLLHKMCPSRDI